MFSFTSLFWSGTSQMFWAELWFITHIEPLNEKRCHMMFEWRMWCGVTHIHEFGGWTLSPLPWRLLQSLCVDSVSVLIVLSRWQNWDWPAFLRLLTSSFSLNLGPAGVLSCQLKTTWSRSWFGRVLQDWRDPNSHTHTRITCFRWHCLLHTFIHASLLRLSLVNTGHVCVCV